MADTLTGWGVRDPEGRLLSILPQQNEGLAVHCAASWLGDQVDGWGCEPGRLLATDLRLGKIFGASFEPRLFALGYRVVRVELREAFK